MLQTVRRWVSSLGWRNNYILGLTAGSTMKCLLLLLYVSRSIFTETSVLVWYSLSDSSGQPRLFLITSTCPSCRPTFASRRRPVIGCRHRQPTVTLWPRRISLTQRLLPTATTAAGCSMFVGGCHKDRLSSPVDWTTVTFYIMASTTNWFADCSQCRMLLPGWLRALGDQITSRLCCASYIGFRCGRASCSRSRRSSTSRCAVTLRATSSTTVSWPPMYALENCVLLTLERSLSTGPAAVSVTGRSLLLWLEYGTVCRLTWENRNCHTASSGGLWRHFYSDSETTAHCELLNCAV